MHSSECSLGRCGAWKIRLCFMECALAAAGLLAGCGTFNPDNVQTRPWNRPTKEEISQDWWFRGWTSSPSVEKPGGYYP